MRGFEYKKAVQSLNYLATKEGGKMNKMKAIKLIWLADRFHLRQLGRTISGDDYFAMDNGPVPSGTRDILQNSDFLGDSSREYSSDYLKSIGEYDFESITSPVLRVLSPSNIKALDTIYLKFGSCNQFVLSDLSHEFPEWKKYESNLKHSSRVMIDLSIFFQNVDNFDLFSDTEEDLSFFKQTFERSSALASL